MWKAHLSVVLHYDHQGSEWEQVYFPTSPSLSCECDFFTKCWLLPRSGLFSITTLKKNRTIKTNNSYNRVYIFTQHIIGKASDVRLWWKRKKNPHQKKKPRDGHEMATTQQHPPPPPSLFTEVWTRACVVTMVTVPKSETITQHCISFGPVNTSIVTLKQDPACVRLTHGSRLQK